VSWVYALAIGAGCFVLGAEVALLLFWNRRYQAGKYYAEALAKIDHDQQEARQAALGRELATLTVQLHQAHHHGLLARQALLAARYAAHGGSLAPEGQAARKAAYEAWAEYQRQGAWQWLQQAEPPDKKH